MCAQSPRWFSSELVRPVVWLFSGLSFCCMVSSSNAGTLHVKTNGNDALPGTTWSDAKRTVGAAIASAATKTDIWIARGTYAEHITLKPGLSLFGGFSGTESSLEQRNWHTNLSAIWGTTNKAVIIITNAGPDTQLNGLTIGGGNGIHGGGVQVVASGPIIANSTVRNNITDGAGAGISIWGFHLLSSVEAYFPIITNNVIVDNQSINDEGDAGGIAVVGSSPLIAWNVIARNTATRNGGGIACWRNSLPTIANNVIEANSASYDELTVSEGGGGIFASATDLDGRPIDGAVSEPFIFNNVIAANGGSYGGGITVIDSRLGAANVVNNTIVGNAAPPTFTGAMGGGIAMTLMTNQLAFANNIVVSNSSGIWRDWRTTNQPVLQHNCVFNSTTNYVNLSAGPTDLQKDPQFVDCAAADFHLVSGSPCIDAGANSGVPSTDKDGIQRPLDGNNDGVAAVDIGACEFVHPLTDTDHDGMPDMAEILAGSDPADPASALSVSADFDSSQGEVVLRWLSAVGRNYSIYFKPGFGLANNWQLLRGNLSGSGMVMEHRDGVLPAGRLYRLSVTRN